MIDRWYEEHFVPRMDHAVKPLWEYSGLTPARISRKVKRLTAAKRRVYAQLRRKHQPLALVAYLPARFGSVMLDKDARPLPPPPLPMKHWPAFEGWTVLGEVLNATLYRTALDEYCRLSALAVAEFDDVFAERA